MNVTATLGPYFIVSDAGYYEIRKTEVIYENESGMETMAKLVELVLPDSEWSIFEKKLWEDPDDIVYVAMKNENPRFVSLDYLETCEYVMNAWKREGVQRVTK